MAGPGVNKISYTILGNICFVSLLVDPQQKLVSEMRKAVLLNQHADGFIWTLLKLMYEADCCIGKKMTLLSKFFSVDELLVVKETIKTLVTVNMQGEHVTNTDRVCPQSFELEIVG